MADIRHKDTLVKDQYKDSKNLDIRFCLHDTYSTNKYGFLNWLFDQLALKENCKILELGCGAGHLWSNNVKRIRENTELILSDISTGMIEEAKSRVKHENIKVMQIDVESIPFEDERFDIVIANHMLYHVPNIDKAISEIQRVLKKDGVFYASTVGTSNMDELRIIVNEFSVDIKYPFTGDLIKFNLENGYEILHKYFKSISIRKYEDSLLINDAKPLVDYVLSLKSWGNISQILVDGRIKEFYQYIDQIIQKDKKIHISKEAGVFIAKRFE